MLADVSVAQRAMQRIRVNRVTYDTHKAEWQRCLENPAYFINAYCQIYDGETWIPFTLWDEQVETLQKIIDNQLTIILKARQLGLTWLLLSYALWLMLFKPIATILIFSKRDDEAMYLLGEWRLKGIYKHLPQWMKDRNAIKADSAHTFSLDNGSVALGFPTTAGDGYVATLAIGDEADLIPNFNAWMGSVKPTIDAGGKLVLISRVDKSKPNSQFKQIYRAAKQKLNAYSAVFLAWWVRPERTQEWYDQQCKDSINNTGSLDYVHEQYPATDVEALAPNTLDKRIASAWLLQCYEEMSPIGELPPECPSIPQLQLYQLPEPQHKYVIGADPAEGNPTSDDSALTVLDAETWEEVAMLAGKFEPTVFAGYITSIGVYFNKASAFIERNNHGHAVIATLRDLGKLEIIKGLDDKLGWLSNTKGNSILYDTAADAFRDHSTTIHSFETYNQLASIEGASLSAPDGDHDDRADSYCIALQGVKRRSPTWGFILG